MKPLFVHVQFKAANRPHNRANDTIRLIFNNIYGHTYTSLMYTFPLFSQHDCTYVYKYIPTYMQCRLLFGANFEVSS
jgi:hypothetical protein